jgi:L-lactate dehydrogenase complex protein LldG
MSNARENILSRLRSTRPCFDAPSPETEVVYPSWQREERIEQLKSVLESVRAEVHLTTKADWVKRLKELAVEKGLNNLLYAASGPLGPEVEAGWFGDNPPSLISRNELLKEWKETLFFDIDAAVTSARAGIAETGSLVLWPNEVEPRSWSLVPPIHFVVLDESKLYDNFQQVVQKEKWHQGLPTNALLISGPSKSADIEQTLAYGVHGPTELIVLVITNS